MLWIKYQMQFEIKKFMLEEFKTDVGPNLHDLVEMYHKESIIQMLYRPCRENFKIMLNLYLEKRKFRKIMCWKNVDTEGKKCLKIEENM